MVLVGLLAFVSSICMFAGFGSHPSPMALDWTVNMRGWIEHVMFCVSLAFLCMSALEDAAHGTVLAPVVLPCMLCCLVRGIVASYTAYPVEDSLWGFGPCPPVVTALIGIVGQPLLAGAFCILACALTSLTEKISASLGGGDLRYMAALFLLPLPMEVILAGMCAAAAAGAMSLWIMKRQMLRFCPLLFAGVGIACMAHCLRLAM